MTARMTRFWKGAMPFAIITLKFDSMRLEDARAIVEAMKFPAGKISNFLERLSVSPVVRQQAAVVTIQYRALSRPHESKPLEASVHQSLWRWKDLDRDSEQIFKGITTALCVFEETSESAMEYEH